MELTCLHGPWTLHVNLTSPTTVCMPAALKGQLNKAHVIELEHKKNNTGEENKSAEEREDSKSMMSLITLSSKYIPNKRQCWTQAFSDKCEASVIRKSPTSIPSLPSSRTKPRQVFQFILSFLETCFVIHWQSECDNMADRDLEQLLWAHWGKSSWQKHRTVSAQEPSLTFVSQHVGETVWGQPSYYCYSWVC